MPTQPEAFEGLPRTAACQAFQAWLAFKPGKLYAVQDLQLARLMISAISSHLDVS